MCVYHTKKEKGISARKKVSYFAFKRDYAKRIRVASMSYHTALPLHVPLVIGLPQSLEAVIALQESLYLLFIRFLP